jgi:signal transduction histidine kinase
MHDFNEMIFTQKDGPISSMRLRGALRHMLFAFLSAGGLFSGVAARCQTREVSLKQLEHTSWSAREGAPRHITALIEGSDGTLWIGSDDGLFNFDGIHFTRVLYAASGSQMPVSSIQALFAASDGTRWVGFDNGEIVAMRDNSMQAYGRKSGLPAKRISQIVEVHDGSLWTIAGQRLLHLRAGHWDGSEADGSLKNETVYRMFSDHTGTLWVATDSAVWYLPPGSETFRRTSEQGGMVQAFAEAHDGSLWIMTVYSESGLMRLRQLNVPGHPEEHPVSLTSPGRYLLASQKEMSQKNVSSQEEIELRTNGRDFPIEHKDLLVDDDGTIWYSTNEGLIRSRLAHVVDGKMEIDDSEEQFTRADGLSGAPAQWILRDRFGDLWVATDRGLDRFSMPKLLRVTEEPPTSGTMVTAGANGEVWMGGSKAGPLLSAQNGTIQRHGKDRTFFNLYCDRDGVIWFSDETGFWRFHSDKFERISLPSDVAPFEVRQIVGEDGLSLFAIVAERASHRSGAASGGIWHFDGRGWKLLEQTRSSQEAPLSLYRDSDGSIWVGYADGSFSVLNGRTGSVVVRRTPSALGPIFSFLRVGDSLLAAGPAGLSRCDLNGCAALPMLNKRTPIQGVTGMANAKDGSLWLNTSRGIFVLTSRDIDSALRATSGKASEGFSAEIVPKRVTADGASIHFSELRFPTLTEDSTGELWFTTEAGLLHARPNEVSLSSPAPIIAEPEISVDGRPLPADRHIGSGTHRIRIHYFGVDLAAPEQVTYRYKLDGVDTDWQDAGQITEATYPSLRHGTYRFHVVASNEDGISSGTDSLEFVIEPALSQRIWFIVASVLVAIALVWTAMVIRTKRLAAWIRLREEHRTEERVRIARDLHDTLLQGIQGLMLRFHVAAQAVPDDEPARAMLERALQSADRIMLEGRDRVNRLRSDMLVNVSFRDAFKTVGAELNAHEAIDFCVDITGAPIEVRPEVFEELFCIGREAITNAFRHSHANKINVSVEYSPLYLRMICQDNGRGMDLSRSRPGHWGLVGMKERASKINAELQIDVPQQGGVRIQATVPGNTAYGRAFQLKQLLSSRAFWRRRRSETEK